MLRITNINTFYGTSHIIHGLSLQIDDGELVSVLGRNGAGKTTLLRSITGINPPKSGTIELTGTDITRLKSHQRTHIGISYVPQGRQIIPDISVEENIHLALLGRGRKANGLLDVAYDYFPALKPIARRKGGVLSGGQQQQLAIARALVQEPKLLLLDEPPKVSSPQSWRKYRRSSNEFSKSVCVRFYWLSSGWNSCARLRSASQFSIPAGLCSKVQSNSLLTLS